MEKGDPGSRRRRHDEAANEHDRVRPSQVEEAQLYEGREWCGRSSRVMKYLGGGPEGVSSPAHRREEVERCEDDVERRDGGGHLRLDGLESCVILPKRYLGLLGVLYGYLEVPSRLRSRRKASGRRRGPTPRSPSWRTLRQFPAKSTSVILMDQRCTKLTKKLGRTQSWRGSQPCLSVAEKAYLRVGSTRLARSSLERYSRNTGCNSKH